MFYETALNNHGLPFNPFKALVVPRPIGWISSISKNGAVNLAPYSFFNGCHTLPPVVMYGVEYGGKNTRLKDSLRNVEETGEFVVNMVTFDLRHAMNQTATHAEIDEMEAAGLEKAPSRLVKPPRVAASPVHLECKYLQTVNMPAPTAGAQGAVVFGQVIGIHIRDDVIVDGRVDYRKIRPIARLGYMDYTVVDEVFSLNRPD
jgi:flavin reductase (DIM6/NTAB) family NADH-FMN oxidoreductase RutF